MTNFSIWLIPIYCTFSCLLYNIYNSYNKVVNELLIHLFPESDIPLYTQLIDEIKLGIAKQELAPGEPLPSVRTMAGDLGINMHTVNKAYQRLKEEGILLIHRQKGVVINPDLPKADQPFLTSLEQNLTRLMADGYLRQLNKNDILSMIDRIYDNLESKGEK